MVTTMNNDTISRAAAIDTAIEAADDWDGGTNIGRQKRIEKAIKALPPVQSEPKSYRMGFQAGYAAAQRWNKCIGEPPKNKSNVLTAIYIPGRQPHVRSGWFEDGLFMNDNGDTWKWTDKEVIAWMYQPKLPEPWGGAQDDTD